ncbi:hypothetical protein BX616_005849, partial [Lobosporangium transversale]
PLESLESVDHEDQEKPGQSDQDDSTATTESKPRSTTAIDGSDSNADAALEVGYASPATEAKNQGEHSNQEALAAKGTIDLAKIQNQTIRNEKNANAKTQEASLNAIVDGFKALLWAELEKVNARYDAQERVASVSLDRLNASFSQTNITGFKKIIKKFDKHYRSCNVAAPGQALSSSPDSSAIHTPVNGGGSGLLRKHQSDSPNAIAYPTTPQADSDLASSLTMINALGIQGHGRSTPTIYLPRNYPEPASSLYAQDFIRNVNSPQTNSKSIFYYNYIDGVSTLSLEFWKMVTERTFAKSEKDEHLLAEARTLWRKRAPVVAERVSPMQLNLDPKDYPVLEDLDLNSLPSGRLTRLWIMLAQDAMSSPIKIPVIVAKGVRPGPVVGLTAALHGNELNGIPLTHRLVLHEIQCQALHGIVVAVPVANVPGYLLGQRGFSDGIDLNRVMPGKKNGSTSQVYSYNLMTRVIRHFTHLIDLHTASKGRVNSLYVRANMQNPTTRHMARLQNPQIIVHNTSPDGSLRGAAMQEYNIPAITVEIGDPARFQKRFVKSAILGVTNILGHLKMIEDEHEAPDYDPVVCAKSYWIFTKDGGILNVLPDVNTWVRKGELIATLYNIFGEEEHRYYAPEDGIVVGKSVDPVCQSGCRILHLGVVSDRFPDGKMDDGHQ